VRAAFVWWWSKIENRGTTEWPHVDDRLIAQPSYGIVFSWLEMREKNRHAERCASYGTAICSIV